MSPYLTFYNLDEHSVIDSIKQTFGTAHWTDVFLKDSHHGFTHGNQVRLASLKLYNQLTPTEKAQIQQEGLTLSTEHPLEYARTAISIGAIFHDCGRFNDQGLCLAEEQKDHHLLSEKRAKLFCANLHLEKLIPFISEAILSHDFQSPNHTPHLSPPRSIIGKIVQSADQMGWFHPDSPQRTMDYGLAIGVPFFDETLPLAERRKWVPGGVQQDILSAMLHQLFGPTAPDRFGIKAARQKVESYKPELEKSILGLAKDPEQREQIQQIIKEYRLATNPTPS